MRVHHEERDRLPDTDDLPQLQEMLDPSPIEHPDVLAGLAEARRLFAGSAERFEAGRILPGLSSLAAVSPLHHVLTERCSGPLLTTKAPESDDADLGTGRYL